jgi:uncharacterized membrane protein
MARADKPLPSLDYLEPRVRISKLLGWLGYFGLMLTLLIHTVFFADLHGARTWVILAVQLVPLLIFVPGILAGSPRTFAFLCFAINLYFIHGVLVCFQPGRGLYGGLLVFLSLLYFLAALGYVRWAFQMQRVRNGES